MAHEVHNPHVCYIGLPICTVKEMSASRTLCMEETLPAPFSLNDSAAGNMKCGAFKIRPALSIASVDPHNFIRLISNYEKTLGY